MIDSLTRRVRQLEDDLKRQSHVHHKESRKVTQQRDESLKQAAALNRKLTRTTRVLERCVKVCCLLLLQLVVLS